MNSPTQRGRITARADAPVIERLRAAADLSGSTLGNFLVQAALEKADKMIEREHDIPYTREDAVFLVNLLEHPLGPNIRLSEAFARRKQRANDDLPGGDAGSGT